MEYIILETKVLNTQNLSLPNYFITFIIFDASEVMMPFVSGWWKYSRMVCHGVSLPNSAFGDITLLP